MLTAKKADKYAISAKSKEKQYREIKMKLIYYSCLLIGESDLVFFFF